MSKSLDETKEFLADKYLGKAGIHSVGLSRAENAIRIYIEEDADDEHVMTEIEAEAAPYPVITIRTPRPTIL
jgi:hypothetical protein